MFIILYYIKENSNVIMNGIYAGFLSGVRFLMFRTISSLCKRFRADFTRIRLISGVRFQVRKTLMSRKTKSIGKKFF